MKICNPAVLTIAGSDSSGGAGIQQDIKVFTVLRAYGASVITALTAQNTLGVQSIERISPSFVRHQLKAVMEDIDFKAIKTGMLEGLGIVDTVSQELERRGVNNLVVDPVMVSKNGVLLLDEKAILPMMERLMPLATIVTPNIPEAEILLGCRITSPDQMADAALELRKRISRGIDPAPHVLLKGGHLRGPFPIDYLATNKDIFKFKGVWIKTPHTHGTGCTLSAALAVFLARGETVVDAVRMAKKFVSCSIEKATKIGSGKGPVNPLGCLDLGYV